MKKLYLVLIVLLVISESCIKKNAFPKLDFPGAMQNEIKILNKDGKILVYYHPGDCSFCYGNIIAISKEFPDIPIVSISASKDYELINYYLEQISFTGISLIDSNSLFQHRNQQVLNTNNLFLIDFQFNIKVAVENFDGRSMGKFKRAIAD